MRTRWRALATLFAASAVSCHADTQGGSLKAADTSGGDVRIEARDNGRRVELRQGSTLTLELHANLSTGYSWQVASSGEPVIHQLGEPTFREDSHMAGAGGTQRYEFRAQQAGTAELALVYVRPWEKGKKPADTFAVTVVVTK